jgi:uncharacterized LabA/DUF88 family protein
LQLNHRRIAEKLAGPRTWVGTRYYIGKVNQAGNEELYASQRRFLASLRATDSRITVHLGRLEQRQTRSEAADELLRYLGTLTTRIDPAIYGQLISLAQKHKTTQVMVEKAVDVMLAVDLVVMAQRDEFDTAYILSADGDFTHAAQFVRSAGKKVFAVAATSGAQLAAVVNSFIRLDAGWFTDCYQ